jgi:hypothetical protein
VDDDDDDDARSVITNITTATITPSESASTIFRNTFDSLQRPSSSGSSAPGSPNVNNSLPGKGQPGISRSKLSTTSTAKATLDPSASTTNGSLASSRTSATKDWSTGYDDEDDGVQTPTESSIVESLNGLVLSDSDDGEGTWITPSNIKKHKIRDHTTSNSVISSSASVDRPRRPSNTAERTAAVMKSACMTGDYAMQNVALQMGLNLVNMEGGGVRQVKTWVLRCHGCFQYPLKSCQG